MEWLLQSAPPGCVWGGAILGEPLGSNTEVGRGTKDREIFRVEAEPERKHFEVR